MRRNRTPLLLAVLLLSRAVLLNGQSYFQGREIKKGLWSGKEVEYVAGELLFKLKSRASFEDAAHIFERKMMKVVREPDVLGIAKASGEETIDVLSLAEELDPDTLFAFVEPNFILKAGSTIPNDDYYEDYQWNLEIIQMPLAWDITTGNAGIKIAILDSGIPTDGQDHLTHEDLDDPNKIEIGVDVVGDGYGVKDQFGHGTHVAGIAGAETNNWDGIAGVSWHNKLLIIQVFNKNGKGSSENFKDGVVYAVDHGAKIINYSGGGDSPSSTQEQAISYAKNHDVLIVVAAMNAEYGENEGGPVWHPAAYSSEYDNVIAVSATNPEDNLSWYSNYGPEINVAAPGGQGWVWDQHGHLIFNNEGLDDDIWSTAPDYYYNYQGISNCTQEYSWWAGTSMAAPHVAGLAGLILSQDPTLKPYQVRAIIEFSADDLGSSGFDYDYGHGRINAYHALDLSLVTPTTSGQLSKNEAWQGTITITGNVTIPPNLTLTILPNAVVNITSGNNIKIIVNGTLRADDATFTSSISNSWYGIVFDHAASASTIDGCTIENAYIGVYADDFDGWIRNSNIFAAQYGIYSCGGSWIHVRNNNITGNTAAVCFSSGHGTFDDNKFYADDGNWGWWLTGTATPFADDEANNYFNGINGTDEFEDCVQIDGGDADFSSGENWFVLSEEGYCIDNNTQTWTDAEYNYWGTSSPHSTYFNGPVDWQPYLSSPPFSLSKSTNEQSDPDINTIKQHLKNGKFLSAKMMAKTYFENSIGFESSPKFLNYFMLASEQLAPLNDEKQFIESIMTDDARLDATKNMALKWQVQQEIREGSVGEAEALVFSVPAKSIFDRELLIDLASALLHHRGDKEEAKKVLAILKERYSEEKNIDKIITNILAPYENSIFKPNAHYRQGEEGDGSDTITFYPNPFNLSTTISFRLKTAGTVQLRILNILGQKVRTLVNRNLEAGYYTQIWNGRDNSGKLISSGVYIIQLVTNGEFHNLRSVVLR